MSRWNCRKILPLLAGLVLIVAEIAGCSKDSSNPTASDTVIRTGYTPGGIPFMVLRESAGENSGGAPLEAFKVRIGDRESVTIETFVPDYHRTVVDSIQVEELVGNATFFHISWRDQFYSLSWSYNYHYLVVVAEVPTSVVFAQTCVFDFDGHYLFNWIRGTHAIEYAGDTMRIVEHWKTCDGSGCGAIDEYQLTEKQLERTFYVGMFGTPLTLLTCEERSRSTGTLFSGDNPPARSLEPPLPGDWTVTDLTLNDILTKCQAQNHGY